MSDNFKIRELVSNHPEDENIVLNDLINNLIQLQVPLGKLEIHQYKESVVEAIKILSQQEKLVQTLKRRLREEVRPEVQKWHREKPKVKKNIHPNSLKNLNQSK